MSRRTPADRSPLFTQIDDFLNKKTGRTSKCYRVNYRSMDRSLSNEEVNKLQAKVLERLTQTLDIELR